MSGSWQGSLPCTRAEAELIALSESDDLLANFPTLVASETDPKADPNQSGSWMIHAYFAMRPNATILEALKAQVPSAEKADWDITQLGEEDWVTMSQSNLKPIRVGRFHIHTSDMPASSEPNVRNLEVPASMAFGTGHHETTRGCIAMLERIKLRGASVRSLLDLGTGTGLLAFAAMHLWPNAYATASDIDPVCGPVLADNAAMNVVPLGDGRGALQMVIAEGLDDSILQNRGPYDLVLANILAGPLIKLAPDIHLVMAAQGRLVLSGLLTSQAEAVIAAYRRSSFRLVERMDDGDWTILYFRKRGHAWV